MAIGKGMLLAGLAATSLGLVAAAGKKKPKPGEPGGLPASALPDAEKRVPAQITASMVRALETGDPTRIRATADVLEKSGYKTQAADLRGGAVVLEREAAKKKREAQAEERRKEAERIAAAAKAAIPTDISASPAIQAAVRSAVATSNPAAMRAVAAKLRDAGATAAAQSLETAAAAVDAQKLAQVTVRTPGITRAPTARVPTRVEPTSTAVTAATQVLERVAKSAGRPVVVTPTPTPTRRKPKPAPKRPVGPTRAQKAALAGQLALAMKGARKGKENKALVTAYQEQEKLPRRDGLYGSTVALSLANTYDIVPPKPLYWGTKTGGYASYLADKKKYKAALLTKGARDPQRSEEWTAAANV